MIKLFSLGELYPSDFLADNEKPSTEKVEMKLMMDPLNGLVRLEKTAPMNKMYGKYWYRSGINNTMKLALKDVVQSICKVQKLEAGDIWLDIASNDGTLLSYVPKYVHSIGCDPADDTFKNEALTHADEIIQDFFSYDAFYHERSKQDKAKVITSIAMFYDVEEPARFITDVYNVLADDGLWVMQLSYSPLMIRQLAFDNICHEHIYYYSLFNLKKLLEEQDLTIVDCELNDVNGGSMRVFIRKSHHALEIGDVAFYRVQALLALEKGMEMGNPKTWIAFYREIEELKTKTVEFIKRAKREGKRVWAYGASTKGNTLLQYFGLDHTLIDGIAERNPEKYNKRTIGTNIPIYSEENMRRERPDYLLLLPWHFVKEFTDREDAYLKKGGKFIVPCPTFKIISHA